MAELKQSPTSNEIQIAGAAKTMKTFSFSTADTCKLQSLLHVVGLDVQTDLNVAIMSMSVLTLLCVFE